MLMRLLPLFLLAAVCGLFFGKLLGQAPSVPQENMVGQPVPHLLLTKLDFVHPVNQEMTVPLALPTGNGYVINFFASWCAPCKLEMPELARLQRQYGVPVIGIAWKDTPQALHGMQVATTHAYRSVLLDPEGKSALALGLTAVPETFAVDANGTIVAHYTGMLSGEDVDAIGKLLSRPVAHAK